MNWNKMPLIRTTPLPSHVQPLLPPPFILPELASTINSAPQVSSPMIGPVQPDNMNMEDMTISDEEKGSTPSGPKENKEGNKDGERGKESREKDNRRDYRDNRERDRGHNQRSRERERGGRDDRNDRNSRFDDRNSRFDDRSSRFDDKNGRFDDRNSNRKRNRDQRDRRSKWSDNDKDEINEMSMMPQMGNQGDLMMVGMMTSGQGMMPSGQGMMPSGQGMMPSGQGMMPGSQGMMPSGQGMMSGGQGMMADGQGIMAGRGMRPGQSIMASAQGIMPGQGMMPGSQGMMAGQAMMPGPGQGISHSEAGIGAGMVPGQSISGMPSSQGMRSSGPGTGMIPAYGMQNIQNTNMNNMQMMPGMNNMMMGNMMMMNHHMMMPNQPIYVTDAILLPPIPGAITPTRREKPNGCRTIFVGGLPKGVTDKTVSEIFQTFGEISDVKVHRQGVCHVRFEKHESVESSFFISGYRFKTHDQTNNEATTLFVDYALNRDDQYEYERSQRHRQKTPPRIELFNPSNLTALGEKIKTDDQFIEAAPTLVSWLERGECNKRNANIFYSMIQASNNQVRRLFNEKMALDEEFHSMKATLREKFIKVVDQFEQVAKILAVAKHQRVSDHFTKQQRRNIDMWLKMTEEVENIKEEFNAMFDEDEVEKSGRNVVPLEKYEQLRTEHETLMFELEGYKNEAYLAKDEAERKFEKFKAHYIAQQALQNKNQSQVFPPLPPPPVVTNMAAIAPLSSKPQPPPPTPDDDKVQTSGPIVPPSEAKLISVLTAFLMVHPLGASLDYLVSYVRSMVPNVTQATVHQTLQKYADVFIRKTSGIGANIEHRWQFATFDNIKNGSQ